MLKIDAGVTPRSDERLAHSLTSDTSAHLHMLAVNTGSGVGKTRELT